MKVEQKYCHLCGGRLIATEPSTTGGLYAPTWHCEKCGAHHSALGSNSATSGDENIVVTPRNNSGGE